MESPRGGLPSLMLSDDGGDRSQGTQGRSSRATENARRERKDPFKQADWVHFARELNTRFPEEPPRTWQETRDKWVSMKNTYQEEKLKQQETGAPPSTWAPWYEIFDGMYNDTARLRRAAHSVDQGVYYPHSEDIVFGDDDEEDDVLGIPPPPPPPPPLAGDIASQSGCKGQMNRSARKRKLGAGNETIALAIEDFSKGILEVEKMKLRLLEKTLESERESREMRRKEERETREMMRKEERETREMMMKSQLEMAALFVEALKGKDFVGSSK